MSEPLENSRESPGEPGRWVPNEPRSWRYWGIQLRWGTWTMTLIAFVATLGAISVIATPDSDNIPGYVIESVVCAALALWIDRCVVQRWERDNAAKSGLAPGELDRFS
jgi:hypothetical protein